MDRTNGNIYVQVHFSRKGLLPTPKPGPTGERGEVRKMKPPLVPFAFGPFAFTPPSALLLPVGAVVEVVPPLQLVELEPEVSDKAEAEPGVTPTTPGAQLSTNGRAELGIIIWPWPWAELT
ncbi:hypothetical protein B0H14DRAFT_2658072 [Mycena olivaceomarginata]|nr:hypothetical protein B0H14DRAFT_2658072 [Mycena olivaceomarginata]